MIDTTFDQAKIIITKDLDNWNSNFWRLWCREQVISKCPNHEEDCANFGGFLRKAELYKLNKYRKMNEIYSAILWSKYDCRGVGMQVIFEGQFIKEPHNDRGFPFFLMIQNQGGPIGLWVLTPLKLYKKAFSNKNEWNLFSNTLIKVKL